MLKTLKQVSSDFLLRNYSHKPSEMNPDWNLGREELGRLSIRWPGKYEWDPARDWVNILLQGFREHVKVEIVDDIPQPYLGTVVYQAILDGRVHDIAIGYSDYMPIDEDCANQCSLYFKMQFLRGGYGNEKVIPGGYVPEGSKIYFQLPKLRKLRDQRQYTYEVYGRFGLNAAREIRERAINILNRQDRFRFEGGMKNVSYVEFLKEVAQSKVCIDLPGQGDFCFRLINYMAVGTFIVAYPHGTDLQVPLVDGKHLVYCKPDYSDLVDICHYYLEHDEEREKIARNSREFFDQYLHKDNLTRYYLRTMLDRLAP
jgi:glycosyltransferase involved in cell wall biosynthesis